MDAELLLDCRATIGESPTWDAGGEALYWIDVKAPSLSRLHLPSGAVRTWRFGSEIGGFAFTAEGDAVVALRDGLFLADLHGEPGEERAPRLLAPPPFDPALHRFNEAACDAAGRMWVGVMFDPRPGVEAAPEPAGLHSFTLAGGLRRERDTDDLHNGVAWSPDNRHFFLAHSYKRRIYRHDFDPGTGHVGEARLFAAVDDAAGIPDGAAMDADGFYWCAIHGGGRLRRYAPDGTLDAEVPLPVSQPTMCAFGGPELDELFVTSARDGLAAQKLEAEPHAGSIFRLRPGVRGAPRSSTVR